MDPITSLCNESPKELLDAQAQVWNTVYSFLNSMALRCALQLGIPDAIQQHVDEPVTITKLANSLALHPNKTSSLTRLMRFLVHSNYFSIQILPNGEEAFNLTLISKVLLKDHPLSIAPYALMFTDPTLIDPSDHFCSWFKNNEIESPFNMAHTMNMWEHAACEPMFNMLFNESMSCDARFAVSLLTNNDEFKGIIEGLESLVDVGGGDGTFAKALTKVFPELTCIVFDLPHVIEGSKGCEKNLQYIGGDMFQDIPHGQAILLKSILHDWSDENCVKILQQCKEAITTKHQGGKIIIIDIVVETQKTIPSYSHSQLLLDMAMMNLTIGGKERNEEEWEHIFTRSGFNEYKIYPKLGPRSIIEIYTS